MNLNSETPIAIIGLGYVGLPLAVEFGKKRKVVGFDINSVRIEDLQAGKDSTLEVEPDELREATGLGFTTNPDDLRDCTCFIVTVPTPIDAHKRPDLNPLIKASETVGKLLKPGDIVIYESTVYPGCTEEDCVPILERESGLKYINADPIAPSRRGTRPSAARSEATWRESGAAVHTPPGSPRAFGPRDDALAPSLLRGPAGDAAIHENGFYVGYSPERINPGDKAHRVTKIKKVTSGSTLEIAETVDALYREIITAGTHKVESIQVAEAAKVIENTQRDLNIALMNELSVLFARMNIDTHDVLRAAGTKWNFLPFRPGLVGGHCIGVDPYDLTHKAEKLGYGPQIIVAGRRVSTTTWAVMSPAPRARAWCRTALM